MGWKNGANKGKQAGVIEGNIIHRSFKLLSPNSVVLQLQYLLNTPLLKGYFLAENNRFILHHHNSSHSLSKGKAV